MLIEHLTQLVEEAEPWRPSLGITACISPCGMWHRPDEANPLLKRTDLLAGLHHRTSHAHERW